MKGYHFQFTADADVLRGDFTSWPDKIEERRDRSGKGVSESAKEVRAQPAVKRAAPSN
jgi:hypothetical protein